MDASLDPARQRLQVLVTGATGFTGWHAARHLRSRGHRVRALVRSADKAERLLAPLGLAQADIVVGDMTDADAVGRALEGCDSAVHAAAAVSVTARGASARFEDNVIGTRLVVGGACERGLRAVIFVSSLTAIFDPRGGATGADSPLVLSATRYGRSKAESDALVRALQAEGAPVTIVYPSAILGPDDPGRSESVRAYRGFLQAMIESSGGTQFVDARDLAVLLETLLLRRGGGRFVAAGRYFGWSELTRCIEQTTGAEIRRIRAPGWLLRAAGSLADGLASVSGRRMPIGREAMEVATRWRAVADSPEIDALGVHWRDPQQTLADMFRWFVEAGHLPAHSVPKLAGGTAAGSASSRGPSAAGQGG